jgi:hypothetical protein
MIEKYIEKLLENLPSYITNRNKPISLDLILDGGMFNGSYLIGGLYFLKELERRKFIKIERISGCSIGSIMGFLYHIDALHLAEKLYIKFFNNFKKKHHLTIMMELGNLLNEYIPQNICKQIKNKFFVTYYNIHLGKKIIKRSYKNKDDIIQSLIKSCFVPIVINGQLLYQNKFLDGINPYIFPIGKRKILYMDLYGYDKLVNIVCVKNEKTNIHRILTGLLDIHTFFLREKNTSMCSYIQNWNISNKISFYIKQFLEKINVITISILLYIKKYFLLKFVILQNYLQYFLSNFHYLLQIFFDILYFFLFEKWALNHL